MLVSHRFFFEALDMHEIAFIIVIGIALASHASRAMLVQGIKIMIDNLLCSFLPASRNGEGHNIPYHKAYSFWFSTAGIHMAATGTEMLHQGPQRADLMMSGAYPLLTQPVHSRVKKTAGEFYSLRYYLT